MMSTIITKHGNPPFVSWEDYERQISNLTAPTPLATSIQLDMRFAGIFSMAVEAYNMLVAKADGMVADNLSQDVLRISINEDGTFNIVDFTLPSSEGRIKKNLAQEDVPQWVMESVSMLRISDANAKVEELGMKVHDKLYYIKERKPQ